MATITNIWQTPDRSKGEITLGELYAQQNKQYNEKTFELERIKDLTGEQSSFTSTRFDPSWRLP